METMKFYTEEEILDMVNSRAIKLDDAKELVQRYKGETKKCTQWDQIQDQLHLKESS